MWYSLSIWGTDAESERESCLSLREVSSRQEAWKGGLLCPLHSLPPVRALGLPLALHTQPCPTDLDKLYVRLLNVQIPLD